VSFLFYIQIDNHVRLEKTRTKGRKHTPCTINPHNFLLGKHRGAKGLYLNTFAIESGKPVMEGAKHLVQGDP
jgi:hypothetical protein